MTTTHTTTTTASQLAPALLGEVDRLVAVLDATIRDGSALVSQSRWVDHLLDLFNLAPNEDLRREITTTLGAIRHRNSVKAADLRDDLFVLTAAVAVESSFDDLLLTPAV